MLEESRMKVNYKSAGIMVAWALFATLVGVDVINSPLLFITIAVLISWKIPPIFSKR